MSWQNWNDEATLAPSYYVEIFLQNTNGDEYLEDLRHFEEVFFQVS